MNKENETKPARELTEKLLAMAAACAANLTKGEAKTAPRFNNLRTVNSYGEFTWQFTCKKGRLVAVINRGGKLYRRLALPTSHFRTAHEDVVEYLQEQLCVEAGNGQ